MHYSLNKTLKLPIRCRNLNKFACKYRFYWLSEGVPLCSHPIQIPHHIPSKSNITKFSSLPSLSLFLPLKSLSSFFYVPLNFPDCRNPSLYSAYLPAYPSPFLMGRFLFLILVSHFQIFLVLKGFQDFSPFFSSFNLIKSLMKPYEKRKIRGKIGYEKRAGRWLVLLALCI